MKRLWLGTCVRAAAIGGTLVLAGAAPAYASTNVGPVALVAADVDVSISARVGAEATVAIPDRIGTEVLSTGDEVDVVMYVHTYPQAIEVYPRVWWAGRWYYNVEGNLVFYDPFYGGWAFYWGPPRPLVTVWNHHHPDVTFVFARGYYGAGYYYGGVADNGWHAHARPPRHYHRGKPFRQPERERAKRKRPKAGERVGPPRRDKRDDKRAKRTHDRDEKRTAAKTGKRANAKADRRADAKADKRTAAGKGKRTQAKKSADAGPRDDARVKRQGAPQKKLGNQRRASPKPQRKRGDTAVAQKRGPKQAPTQRAKRPAPSQEKRAAPNRGGQSRSPAKRGGGGGKRGR
jgi:hypothetical protein